MCSCQPPRSGIGLGGPGRAGPCGSGRRAVRKERPFDSMAHGSNRAKVPLGQGLLGCLSSVKSLSRVGRFWSAFMLVWVEADGRDKRDP